METINNNIKNISLAMTQSTQLTIIVISLITIIIILIVYRIYKYFKNFCKHSSLIFGPRPADYALEKYPGSFLNKISLGFLGEEKTIVKKEPFVRVLASELPRSIYGYDYTYSLWLNVDDWNYGNGQPKHIFHKGDSFANVVNPGVWLYPDTNSLMIRVSTHGEETNVNKTMSNKTCKFWDIEDDTRLDWEQDKTGENKYTSKNYPELKEHNYCRNPDNQQRSWCYPENNNMGKEKNSVPGEPCVVTNWEEGMPVNPLFGTQTSIDLTGRAKCDIVNIPLQRWIHVVLVMHNRTLDVFLNGKLARSCTYENVPKYNDGNLYCLDRGGFKGKIGEFRYFNRALDANEIYKYYRCGYKCQSLYDNLCNFKIKGDISFSTSIGGIGSEDGGLSKSASFNIG